MLLFRDTMLSNMAHYDTQNPAPACHPANL